MTSNWRAAAAACCACRRMVCKPSNKREEDSMNNKNIRGIVAAAMLMTCALAQAKDALRVQVPAAFAEQTPIEPRVKDECAVDSVLGNHVFQKIADKYPGTLQVSDPAK